MRQQYSQTWALGKAEASTRLVRGGFVELVCSPKTSPGLVLPSMLWTWQTAGYYHSIWEMCRMGTPLCEV